MSNEKKQWWLYILKLEQGKWYVGITTQTPEKRFWEHQHHVRGAYWTKKYAPVSIELTEDLGIVTKGHAEECENEITRRLMKKRGLNNVRGGDLTDVDKYLVRFGWVRLREQWILICWLLFFMSTTLFLLIYMLFVR